MSDSAMEEWNVEIIARGRCGVIIYHEGGRSISFDWEFGGSGVLAIIWAPKPSQWNRQHPWAVERRPETFGRVAQEVIRQKAPGCRADVEEANGYTYIRSNAA